jgi:hypothetical protein
MPIYTPRVIKDIYIARQSATTWTCLKWLEKDAQAVAKEYGIPVSELSDADPYLFAYIEVHVCMDISQRSVSNMACARHYEKLPQAVAEKYLRILPVLSDADIHAIQEREDYINIAHYGVFKYKIL